MASKVIPIKDENTESDFNLHARINHQIHLLLKDVEEEPDRFAFKDRLSMITTIGMFLTRDIKLKEAEGNAAPSGSKVRNYAGAFKTRPALRKPYSVDDSDEAS